jgi:hypothetical protein
MSRNASGTYTLPIGAFSTGQVIQASDHNSNYSDIATALTQSLATTGVSTMTGPVVGTGGTVAAPSYTFTGDTGTGFFLSGTHIIGIATNGSSVGTFNSNQTVTWAAGATFSSTITVSGAATFNAGVTHASTFTQTGAVTLNATSYTFGAGAAAGWWTGIATPVDIAAVMDGGGSVILSTQKGTQLHIPYPLTITKWWVMSDVSGSISFDILRANNAVPSVSIVGAGTKPNLSSSQFTSAAPSSWTATTLATDDFITINISGSPTTVTKATLVLTCTRTG